MPGWKTSIAHCKSISDLPPNAKAYAEKIWELSGIPGETISYTQTLNVVARDNKLYIVVTLMVAMATVNFVYDF